MKAFFSPLFLGLFALIFSISTITYAAGTAPKKPTPTPKPTPRPPAITVIESISPDSITIATGPKKETYKIKKDTKFLFNGQDTTEKDLKAGMRVTVITGLDDKTADEIKANKPPKGH